MFILVTEWIELVISVCVSKRLDDYSSENQWLSCMRDSEGLAMADASPFQGVHLHHFARETSDVNRMVEFYQQVRYRYCLHVFDSVVLFVILNMLV